MIAKIAAEIRRVKFSYSTETQLQEAIAEILLNAGIMCCREVRLKHGRIDLLAGRVGIEVKIAGATADVARQLGRYLSSDELDGLVLVTTRVSHLFIPATVEGKPVEVVTLAWAGL